MLIFLDKKKFKKKNGVTRTLSGQWLPTLAYKHLEIAQQLRALSDLFWRTHKHHKTVHNHFSSRGPNPSSDPWRHMVIYANKTLIHIKINCNVTSFKNYYHMKEKITEKKTGTSPPPPLSHRLHMRDSMWEQTSLHTNAVHSNKHYINDLQQAMSTLRSAFLPQTLFFWPNFCSRNLRT